MTSDNRTSFFRFYPLIQLIVLSKYLLSDTRLDTVFRMLNNIWSLTSKSCHLGGGKRSKPKLQDNVTRMYKDTMGVQVRGIQSGWGTQAGIWDRHVRGSWKDSPNSDEYRNRKCK